MGQWEGGGGGPPLLTYYSPPRPSPPTPRSSSSFSCDRSLDLAPPCLLRRLAVPPALSGGARPRQRQLICCAAYLRLGGPGEASDAAPARQNTSQF
eukprot:8016700-Pyramimonas_sp.AAC.1